MPPRLGFIDNETCHQYSYYIPMSYISVLSGQGADIIRSTSMEHTRPFEHIISSFEKRFPTLSN